MATSFQHSHLKKPMDRGVLAGYIPWGHKTGLSNFGTQTFKSWASMYAHGRLPLFYNSVQWYKTTGHRAPSVH